MHVDTLHACGYTACMYMYMCPHSLVMVQDFSMALLIVTFSQRSEPPWGSGEQGSSTLRDRVWEAELMSSQKPR